MHVPTLFGVIKRRFLVNYQADPEAKHSSRLAFRTSIEYGHVERGMRQFKHLALTDG